MTNLIVDRASAAAFLEKLPPAGPGKLYYGTLMARQKYWPDLPSSSRDHGGAVSNSRDGFLRRLSHLCEVGPWYVTKDGATVPSHAFAVYVMTTPSDAAKAVAGFLEDAVKSVRDVMGREMTEDDGRHFNGLAKPAGMWSRIAKAPAGKYFFLVDVDEKDEKTLDDVVSRFPVAPTWATETRGGYHVGVPWTKETGVVFGGLKKKKSAGDPSLAKVELFASGAMTVLPGSLQGGFVTKDVTARFAGPGGT